MHLLSIPSFIPMGPLRRRRARHVAALRAEDAKLQAERVARMSGTHTVRRSRPRPDKKPQATTHVQAQRPAKPAGAPLESARVPVPQQTFRPRYRPARVTPVRHDQPAVLTPTQPAPANIATPALPAPTAVAAPTPSPIAAVVQQGRGTYANDFSRRGAYTTQASRS
ncbi:MAG TPA: hypothetical protein VLE73_05150 [Candidatus Saccharimonadales bacterium]|nr:hypothetical protein [Candidatus Saccharimonadales bacterium]